ncbi:hypothetical protein TWF481_011685 [Arthrobotrys musiformis]|uniref:Uncharacterized protein n=1 Tax=Arthrobotrys musiformis TaxID=47236 RepID=A0AAV9VZ66_9PEZI
MPQAKGSSTPMEGPLNPENVKIIPFTGPGEDPASLVGLLLISATPIHGYPLTLSFRQYRKGPRDVEIHSSVLGRFFHVEVCDLLREHLPKATGIHPLKVIAAAFGSKKVEYSAPYALPYRHLFRKKRTDEYNLIGLQLEGMSRMGWIWAEDLDRSFEEGQIKSSVYIPTETLSTIHRPKRIHRLSVEDLKKLTVPGRVSARRGGARLIQLVLGDRDADQAADLSTADIKDLERMMKALDAGLTTMSALQHDLEGRKQDHKKTQAPGELSDLSELSEHDSISSDIMDFDLGTSG